MKIPNRLGRLRVTPASLQGDAVELRIDNGGPLISGGSNTKAMGVNRIAVKPTSSGTNAEADSVFGFGFSAKHIHLTGVRVDHINSFSQEVSLEACTILLFTE
jgi:hypothetical protein